MNKNTKKGGDMKRVYLIGSIVVGIFFVLISFPKGQNVTSDFDLTPEESTPSKKEEPKKPSITPKPIIPSTPKTTLQSTPTTTSQSLDISKKLDSLTLPETLVDISGTLMINNGNPSGIAKCGDFLYMAMNESWSPLVAYNISDPKNPTLIKYLGGNGWPVRCRVIDNKWLWAFFPNGENILDISDPANPKFLDPKKDTVPPILHIDRIDKKEWKPEYFGKKFIRHGNLSYCTHLRKNIMYYAQAVNPLEKDSPSVTLICDISDPKDPKLLSTVEGGIVSGSGGLVDNLMFTADGKIYDVSNPSSPKKLAELKTEDFPELTEKNIKIEPDVVTYNNGIVYVGLSRPMNSLFSKVNVANSPLRESGIAAIDMMGFNGKPKLLGWYIIEGELASLDTFVYHKGHIFSSDVGFGLRVFDVKDPKNIQLVAKDRQGGELSAVAYIPSKKLLCIGQNITGGFVFVDVSDPTKPKIVSQLSVAPSRIWGYMAVYKDRYLYAQGDFRAGGWYFSHLFGIDLQDPKNPKLVCAVGAGRSYGAVCVDNYLYLSSGGIFDISDPENPKPVEIKETYSGDWASQIIARKPYLYVTTRGGGFAVVDITEPKTPKVVGRASLPSGHRLISMSFLGKYVIVGLGGNVIAVDVSDPKNPVIAAKWGDTEIGFGELKEVWSDGKYLFVGAYHRNVRMYEVKEKEDKTLELKQIKRVSWVPAGWQIYGDAERKLIFRIGLGGLNILKY